MTVSPDGVREVHVNTIEGFWQGLRNFLRRFRGVSKWTLSNYVALYQFTYNARRIADLSLAWLRNPTSAIT